MTQQTRPDHDAEIEICGEVYWFKRSHELLKRLEQRFGALIPLARRVEQLAATQTELAGVLEELVRGGGAQRPGRLDLERWVWEEGSAKISVPLARILYELPIGNRTLRLLEEEKAIVAAEQQEADAAARPTQPPASGQAERAPRPAEEVLQRLAAQIASMRETAA